MLDWVRQTRDDRVRPALKALTGGTPPPESRWSRDQRLIYNEYQGAFDRERRNGGFLVATSDELMRSAQKTLSFNQYVLDFINDAGYRDNVRYYDRGTLENAYRTSVYLFAFLRLGADMLSTVRVAAEEKRGETWVEMPEDEPITQIFAEQGPNLFFRGYMNYALYGSALIYMEKTRQAVMRWAEGHRDSHLYANGGLAGLHVVGGNGYELDMDYGNAQLRGFHVTAFEPGLAGRGYLNRNECVYLWDFDPRDDYRGTSMVAAAIHNAVTNAAIARWASHYFTTGAMPMVLISAKNSDKYQGIASDLNKVKAQFEQNWRGVGASMRSFFTNQQVQVDQVGIPAEQVAAPELNRSAMEGISAAVRIPPDLVIPPEGGSDNARHKYLMKQCWEDTIIPMAEQFVSAFNRDLGLPRGMRLFVDRHAIEALQADKADRASVELNLSSGGVQFFNESRQNMDMPAVREMKGMLQLGGTWQTIDRIRRQDRLWGAAFTDLQTAWDSNLFTRAQVHAILDIPLPPGVPDGYKFEVVQESTSGGMSDIQQKLEGAGPQALLPGSTQKPGGNPPGAPPTNPAPPPMPPSGGGPTIPLPATNDLSRAEIRREVRRDARRMGKAEKAASVGNASLWALAMIAEEGRAALGALQLLLISQLPDDAIVRLTPRDEFHVTLWHVPVFGAEEEPAYLSKLPQIVDGHVVIRNLGVFPQDAETWCVYAEVEKVGDDAASLLALRDQFAPPLPDERLSSYSLTYKPHLTLAYVANVEGPLDPTAWLGDDYELTLLVGSVDVGRGENAPIRSIPARGSAQASIQGEREPEPAKTPESPESHEFDPSSALRAYTLKRGQWATVLGTATSYNAIDGVLPNGAERALRTLQTDGIPWEDAQAASLQALDAGWFDPDAALDADALRTYLPGVAAQGNWKSELDAWERSALRNFNKAVERFQTHHLPKSMADDLRATLKTLDRRDHQSIRATFAGARDSLAQPTSDDHVRAWAERLAAVDDDDLKALFDGNE